MFQPRRGHPLRSLSLSLSLCLSSLLQSKANFFIEFGSKKGVSFFFTSHEFSLFILFLWSFAGLYTQRVLPRNPLSISSVRSEQQITRHEVCWWWRWREKERKKTSSLWRRRIYGKRKRTYTPLVANRDNGRNQPGISRRLFFFGTIGWLPTVFSSGRLGIGAIPSAEYFATLAMANWIARKF